MSIYAIAIQTPNSAGAAQPTAELIAATAMGFRLLEFGYMASANEAHVVSLGTPQAKGITPTSPITVLPEDVANTATGQTKVATLWATPPTIPRYPIRRFNTTGLISVGVLATFPPRGEAVAPNSSFVVWNYGSGYRADIWFVVDE